MAERNYRPLWDFGDDVAPGALTWLQAWYAQLCDGDWEHAEGIRVETLDNPGWRVRISLRDTPLESNSKPRSEVYRSKYDWCTTWVEDATFHAACGPLNLGEAIHDFRSWAQPVDWHGYGFPS